MNVFLEYQVYMSYRVPLNEDGSLGKPQMTRYWVRPIKDTDKQPRKPRKIVSIDADEAEEGFM